MIIEKYKHNKKIICFIAQFDNVFKVCTGKPSDITCLSWQYNNLKEAQKTAIEYVNNYKRIGA